MEGWTAATRLRVYVGERDQWRGDPLARAIVRTAREHGLAGATVLRGVEGYGADSRLRTHHPFALSEDLPLVVEIIDAPDRVQGFLPVLDGMMAKGLVTLDPVEAVFYGRSASAGGHGPAHDTRQGR